MNLPSQDTSLAFESVKYQILVAMTPVERIERFCRLWQSARAFAVAGIKLQHPEADEVEIKHRLAVRVLGADLAKKHLGWDVNQRGY